MKIDVRTLSNESFKVELEPTDTGLQAKQKIAALKPAFEPGQQKLIHSGKVLKDDEPISVAGVKEGSFLVCMVTKPKAAAPAPAPAAAAPAPAPAAAAPAPAPSAGPSASTSASTSEANPFAGAEFESAVTEIKSMGFPEDQVRVALRAAFGNPDRAVDYLMNGIPAAATAAANRRAAGPAAAAAPSGAASGPLDVLRSHPQFAQLKMLVQSNPAALPQVLAQIGAASPDLLALINANKDAFIAMMNEPLTEEEEGEGEEGDEEMGDEEGEEGDEGEEGMPGQMAQLLAMVAGMPPEQRAAMAAQIGIPPAQLEQLAQAAAAGGMGGGGPGTTVVRLTADEAAAVDRLCAMGFERNTVLQAYLACDKNEELAANMLLEGGFDDM